MRRRIATRRDRQQQQQNQQSTDMGSCVLSSTGIPFHSFLGTIVIFMCTLSPGRSLLLNQPHIQHSQPRTWCHHLRRRRPLWLTVNGSKEEAEKKELETQLEKARAVLAVSRAKMEALDDIDEEDDETTTLTTTVRSDVPFFASISNGNDSIQSQNGDKIGSKKKNKVIKNQNKDTGLFTTDGDLMAKLSEEEEWESRSLREVFSNERKSTSLDEKDPWANRDVAASIYNLRKSLQLEDYKKIFDKRNRFIGEQ